MDGTRLTHRIILKIRYDIRMANERNMIWNYPLITTSENKQGMKTFTPKEFSYETVGVDFSTKGGIRPFPGFTAVHTFSSLAGHTLHSNKSEITDVFPVTFRIGTDYFAYGFVYRAKQDASISGASSDNGDIFIDYYIAGEDPTWTTGVAISAVTGAADQPMDVVVFGRKVYVLVKGQEPVLFYVDYEAIAAATCSINVAAFGSFVHNTSTLTLISTSGATCVLTAITSGSQTPLSGTNTTGTFLASTDNNTTADNIATSINGSDFFTAPNPDAAQVTVTQATSGSAGNTIVTLSAPEAAGSKSNFTGGTGVSGSLYTGNVVADTGPGAQIEVISPNSTDSAVVGTLAQPTANVIAQAFTTNTVGTPWDATPEDMDDVASLEAGDYAVGIVLTDTETNRKTSLSKLAQIKPEHLTTKAEGSVTFLDADHANYATEYVTINDGTNTVKFSFDVTVTPAAAGGGGAVKVNSTNYTLSIDGLVSTATIAAVLHTGISLANTNGDLDIASANSSSATCNLTHTKGTTDGNVDIVVYTTDGDITVTGMAGAGNFDPGNLGIEIVYDSSKFDRARVYRSVKTQNAGGVFSASIVQLDKIITLSDYLVTDQTGMSGNYRRAIYYFRLDDLALIYQDPYIDRSIFDENMPKAGTGIEFDGVLLASDINNSGSSGSSSEEGSLDQYRGLGEFRWSSMAESSPELFPPENFYIPSKISSEVKAFSRSGGVTLGFCNNLIMHISREFAGMVSYMKILPIHEGFGIVNKSALQTVGPFTYYVSNKGVKTVDAQARLDSLHALDGIIEEWKSDFTGLSMSFDAQSSVIFILNNVKKEAALLWMNTASVSELHDLPFVLTTTGQWPSVLTNLNSELTERAFFLQNHPNPTTPTTNFHPTMWVADSKRENLIASSRSSDFNGEQRITLLDGVGDTRFLVASQAVSTASTGTVTVNGSEAGHDGVPVLTTADANWTGAFMYIIGVGDVANESRIGNKAQISLISGSVITYINATSGFVLSAGDRIGISPVYVKWEGSLLGYNDPLDPNNPSPSGLHIARIVDSMSAYFSSVSGAPTLDSVNTKDNFYKGSIYQGDTVAPIASSIPVNLSGDHCCRLLFKERHCLLLEQKDPHKHVILQ